MAAVAESAVGSEERKLMHERSADCVAELSRSMTNLVEALSKLNPWAKEFVPSSRSAAPAGARRGNRVLSADAPLFVVGSEQNSSFKESSSDGYINVYERRRNFGLGKKWISDKVARAQREDKIRRTVYVSDIDHNISEEQLAALFGTCGQVTDCRVCGDPNSVLRFAFIEFGDEDGARTALHLSGTMLGYYPLRVLPSKTAILPVNPSFLPQSEDEKRICVRTIYCTNIDKKVTQLDVKNFFESCCGEVSRLRLLGDHKHLTRIAFVEFVRAGSAITALNCSGLVLGTLPIRVSPSKTPVRSRLPRPMIY